MYEFVVGFPFLVRLELLATESTLEPQILEVVNQCKHYLVVVV